MTWRRSMRSMTILACGVDPRRRVDRRGRVTKCALVRLLVRCGLVGSITGAGLACGSWVAWAMAEAGREVASDERGRDVKRNSLTVGRERAECRIGEVTGACSGSRVRCGSARDRAALGAGQWLAWSAGMRGRAVGKTRVIGCPKRKGGQCSEAGECDSLTVGGKCAECRTGGVTGARCGSVRRLDALISYHISSRSNGARGGYAGVIVWRWRLANGRLG